MSLFGSAGLAGTTFAAALLQAISGFGFAVLAVPLYLLLAGTAAQTVARDASRILCAIIRGDSCIPCRHGRHPGLDLGGCRRP